MSSSMVAVGSTGALLAIIPMTWETAASRSGWIPPTTTMSTTTSAISKTRSTTSSATSSLWRIRLKKMHWWLDSKMIQLEDDPKCPDAFCKCPYHLRPNWPPNSPPSGGASYYDHGGPSGGAGYYDLGGPSQYYPNQFV